MQYRYFLNHLYDSHLALHVDEKTSGLTERQLAGLLKSKKDFLDFITTPAPPGDPDNFDKVKSLVMMRFEDNTPPRDRQKEMRGSEWKEYQWHEKLSWCRDYAHMDPANFEKLKIINDFVSTVKDDEPVIPIKERSLLMFGREHMLDELSKGRLFISGKLTLDLLRCYKTWLPIVHEDFNPSKGRAIIIENRDTFFSFCKACSEMPVSPYKYVLFGNGSAIYDSILGIHELKLERGEIEFFGDIDAMGMEIPMRVQESLDSISGNLKIVMAEPFYDKAIELYEKCGYRIPGKKFKWRSAHFRSLPERFRPIMTELYHQTERIPQEIVNYMEIKKIVEQTAKTDPEGCP